MSTASITGLELFGSSKSELPRLGSVSLTVRLGFWYPPTRPELRMPPKQRSAFREEKMRKVRAKVVDRYSIVPKKETGLFAHRSIDCTIKAAIIPTIAREPGVKEISIRSFPGRRKRRSPRRTVWYAVKARFACEIEGKRRGEQTYEDRIVIVRARTDDEAVSNLRREFKNYVPPYLNSRGEMVRWRFERVMHVYQTFLEVLVDGAEVWSEYHGRRMKPSTAWLPKW